MPEAGRAVIRDEVAAGGTALPWDDRDAFAERMLAHDLNSYEEARMKAGVLFFDRGIPDIIGYRILCGLGIPGDLTRAAESRSEEHTSELQSLLRTSYAIFCLKKKHQNLQSNKYYLLT